MKPSESLLSINQSHAAFQQVAPSKYRVEKDLLNHFSTGSIVSGQMLNCYRSIVPSATRITVFDLNNNK